MSSDPHPDNTLEILLTKPNLMASKRARLQKLHRHCQRRFDEGHRYFTIAEVSLELEAEGIMPDSSFRHADSPEYRELANSWQSYSDNVEFGPDTLLAQDHPDSVFRNLLKHYSFGHSSSILRAMHRVCRDRFAKFGRDFAFRSVSREALQNLSVSSRIRQLKSAPRAFSELTQAWGALSLVRGDGAPIDQIQGPQETLSIILRKPTLRSNIADTYRSINEICEARFERGEYDFGTIVLAKDLVEAGVSNYDKRLPSRLQNVADYSSLLTAWQKRADDLWIRSDEDLPVTHPDAVFRRIRGKPAHADQIRRLLAVHRACHLQHAKGSTDFSRNTIGKSLAEQKILAQRTLRSTMSEDIRDLIAAWDAHARPWIADTNKVPPATKTKARAQKSHDVALDWVRINHPELEEWRRPAAEWLSLTKAGLSSRISAMNGFFDHYLRQSDSPTTPDAFFRRGSTSPDFNVAIGSGTAKHTRNNYLKEFFDWLLLKDFSFETDDGALAVSPEFRNPVSRMSSPPGRRHWQSVRSPLPYGYIHELRHLLAQGQNFSAWKFAQNAQGAAEGDIGAPARDWYEVRWEDIDEADPDCVWRLRVFKKGKRQRSVIQLWSPVRWVALLIKLLLPLRTGQVRLLDSGESDTLKYVAGGWVDNYHALAKSNTGSWQQGVFRRNADPANQEKISTVLFINTNKTADIDKSGPEKGYVMPWFQAQDPVENVFYWLEKLRNWQEKYNPILRRTHFRELDARHLSAKTAEQLASYPECCFLFRTPECGADERMLPVSDGVVSHAWMCLLKELQQRVAARGETHPGGAPIEFIADDVRGRDDPLFPLHSLRVSLITALALDGEVPFPILQKLVGHSRLLMTLYYTKPGAARISDVLVEAAQRLSANASASIYEFLLNTEHAALVDRAISNSAAAVAIAIAAHPSQRNAAGWMLMHHGLCLVGGNVSEIEDHRKIGGCYNGGPEFGRPGEGDHSPVPGGSRNCIRCRWFVTEPHFIPALAAHFNTTAYHFDEARNVAMAREQALQQLRREKAEMEADGSVYTELRTYLQAERLAETSMKRFSDLAEDLVACWRLIERCTNLLNSAPATGVQLLIQGAVTDVRAVFEETESELLQLCGVCDSIELYPDLEADKAVLRRSQLLDSALLNDGLPPMFLKLSQQDQLKVGNAFVRRLSQVAAPADLFLGQRVVVGIIDAGEKLGEALGVDLAKTVVESESAGAGPQRVIRIASST